MATSFYSVIGAVSALAAVCGRAFVVLEATNSGGSQNLGTALPSLNDDQLDILSDGPLVLGYDTDADAQKAFNAFSAEAVRGYDLTSSLVESVVHYVGRIDDGKVITTSNSSDAATKTLHAFFGGRLVNLSIDAFSGAPAMSGMDPTFAKDDARHVFSGDAGFATAGSAQDFAGDPGFIRTQ